MREYETYSSERDVSGMTFMHNVSNRFSKNDLINKSSLNYSDTKKNMQLLSIHHWLSEEKSQEATQLYLFQETHDNILMKRKANWD